VSNTPGAVDEATATTAVYLLIATMRRFSECEAQLRSGAFGPLKHVEAGARDLSGKTIGILGMTMIYHNRRQSTAAPADVPYVPELYDMLRIVDVLLVSIPLSDTTRGFIGANEIRAMKQGSIIINTARGPIIDEEAMIMALQDGHVSLSPFP